MRRTRVLVVDDSAAARRILCQILAADGEIEVVGTAADAASAWEKMGSLAPDVVMLDAALASRDASGFLAMMRRRPTPVVMVGSGDCPEAAAMTLRVEAADCALKPSTLRAANAADLGRALMSKVKAAAWARPHPEPRPELALSRLQGQSHFPVIAVGASLGGVKALRHFLAAMPPDSPGILIVQHMPPAFTRRFADRCDAISAIRVKEAEQGDPVRRGLALIAPGSHHMRLVRTAQGLCVALDRGPRVSGHRPSVDVLFESVAAALGGEAVGVILTGMGRDGAQGLLKMKQAGASTVAQDEASCVVFGMPQEAISLGAVDRVLPLAEIAAQVLLLAEGRRRPTV